MRTIAIMNQKGGVGKTTTAATLAAGLMRKGYKTLLIDLDGQCDLTFICGGVLVQEKNALELLRGNIEALDAVQETTTGHLIPGDRNLYALTHIWNSDAETISAERQNTAYLRTALEPLQTLYDYCIIDTPPALSDAAACAIIAADEIILTTTPAALALNKMEITADTVKQLNENCSIAGVLITKTTRRRNITKMVTELIEQTAANIGAKVYNATIRELAELEESNATRTNIFEYKPKGDAAADYINFINEFLLDELQKTTA